MAEDVSWVPPGVDASKASIARVYDYWLGGTRNLLVDRDVARAVIAAEPNMRAIARENRDFLGRVVRLLARSGVRQFLDIGSGIPTQGNVHEVAQAAAPGSRVVYVDIDPVAVAHSEAILRGNPDAAVARADLREPEAILCHPQVSRLIDFGQPVGLLLAAVLHFVPDDEEPQRIISTLCGALPAGSYLMISHAASDGSPEMVGKLAKMYTSRVATRLVFRSPSQIARFFDGLEILDPGVVEIGAWRPDAPAAAPAHRHDGVFAGIGAVGRKPPSA